MAIQPLIHYIDIDYRKDLIDRSLGEFSLREKYYLLLYLEVDISMIQAYVDIIGYTNKEI